MGLLRRIPALWMAALAMTGAHAGTLVRVFTTDYPPYASPALPGQGAAVRMLRELLEPLGYSPVVDFQPWARLGQELQTGRYDLVLLAWPGDLTRHGLIGGSPWFASRLGLYVRRADWRPAGRPLTDATSLRIGIVRDYAYPDALMNGSLTLEPASSDAQNLRKLVAGRIDAVALERAVGQHLLGRPSSAGGPTDPVWQEPAFAVVPIYAAVVPRRPLSEPLQKALAEGLQAYRRDRRYARLLQDNDLDGAP